MFHLPRALCPFIVISPPFSSCFVSRRALASGQTHRMKNVPVKNASNVASYIVPRSVVATIERGAPLYPKFPSFPNELSHLFPGASSHQRGRRLLHVCSQLGGIKITTTKKSAHSMESPVSKGPLIGKDGRDTDEDAGEEVGKERRPW